MDFLYAYFIQNYFLLCIVIALTIICVQKIREHKRLSIYIFVISGLLVTLSVTDSLRIYLQDSTQRSHFLMTFLASFGYVLRSACVLIFIMLSETTRRKKWFYILLFLPIAVCLVVYVLPLIPGCEHIVFYYQKNLEGAIVWKEGDTPLRFTSHIVAMLYLTYLVYRSLSTLKAKHIYHSISLLACAAVVIIAVIIETFFNSDGKIQLLNTSVAICIIFYYLFLYMERMQYSALTGLLNRSAYFSDLRKMKGEVTAVIQADMNGLKYWNDTFGHLEGDLALKTISAILRDACTRRMYAYRLGGDEFTILAVNEKEERVIEAIRRIKNELAKTKYRCSIGFAYRKDKSVSFEEMIKDAEKLMYQDKADFYKSSTFERRQTNDPTD